jgi:hypothetical protein
VIDNESLSLLKDKANISINSAVKNHHYFNQTTGERII